VLLFISLEPLMAAGEHTFINDLLGHAGAINLAATVPGTYPAMSREAVVAEAPDAIIITSDLAQDVPSLLKRFPEWAQLKAVQSGQVFRIDPDLVSRPGPRAVNALELLVHFLYSTHP
jgi:iron complex transport system substrate-binding protein